MGFTAVGFYWVSHKKSLYVTAQAVHLPSNETIDMNPKVQLRYSVLYAALLKATLKKVIATKKIGVVKVFASSMYYSQRLGPNNNNHLAT